MLNLHTNTCDFPIAIKNSNSNTCIGFIDNDNHARTIRKYTNSNICKSEKKISAIFSKESAEKDYKNVVYINGGIDGIVKNNVNEKSTI